MNAHLRFAVVCALSAGALIFPIRAADIPTQLEPSAVPRVPVPKSPFIAVVYRYADTMLESGRDVYGPEKSGLFLSALDRHELALLKVRPAPPKPADTSK